MRTVARILLVEDSPSDADVLRERLSRVPDWRFEIAWVETLAACLERLREGSFDVMLLDLSLPDSTGADTVLRARAAAPRLPIVVLTGVHDEAVGLDAVRHGVQDYLVKSEVDGRHVARAIRYAIERMRADEALLVSEQKFATAFANNPAAIALTRLDDGVFLDVNDTWVRLNGYTRDEVIDRCARTMPIWPTPEAAARFVMELRREGRLVGWEQEFRKKSGELFLAELSAQVLSVGGQDVILTTLVDVTARRRAEEALRETEERLEAVFAAIPSVVIEYDRELSMVRANEAARKLLGLESLDLTREMVMGRLNATHLDGSPIRIEELPTSRALRGEIITGALYRVRPPDGIERTVSTSAVPLYKGGEISGAVALWYDVTEQRRLEELRDSLVHMVVHDLTTPLTALGMNVELVRRSLGAEIGADAGRFLGLVERGIARLMHMIEDLLDANRLEAERLPLNFEECDLAELVRSAVADAGALVTGAEVSVQAPGSLEVRCDPGLVRRVVENLVSNALKHNPPDGVVEVRLGEEGADARVTVRDHGEGIPPEFREAIFAKFGTVEVRKQRKYHSTGLGLTFCRLAVQAHGGRIGVEGEPGDGSTFWFTLPRR